MAPQIETLEEKTIREAREALERARALRRSRRKHGVDGIRQFVADVDGDWMENWSTSASISLNLEVRDCTTTARSRFP